MKNLLIKIRDELAKEKPDLSYCRGILEVLIDKEDEPQKILNPMFSRPEIMNANFIPNVPPFNPTIPPTFVNPGFVNPGEGVVKMPIDNSNEAA